MLKFIALLLIAITPAFSLAEEEAEHKEDHSESVVKEKEGLTRVRAVGNPEWRMSKFGGGTIKVRVRNVGDYTAKGVSASVKVNGKNFALSGGETTLEPNATTTFQYSGIDLVVLGGKYPTHITCINCHK